MNGYFYEVQVNQYVTQTSLLSENETKFKWNILFRYINTETSNWLKNPSTFKAPVGTLLRMNVAV